MNVIGLQYDIAWENKPANFNTVHRLIAANRPPSGSLVVLPEMFATGFSMNAEAIAEDYNGETEQFLSRTAKEFGIGLIAGVAVRSGDGRARNKALMFSPDGSLLAYYAKIKPFRPGGEAEHYTAGERITVFDFADCRVAPFICYDLRFPELFRQAAALERPELFIVIASWPEKRIHHWRRLAQARAIENQAYVIAVNRVGTDPFYTYNGNSIIVDPQGDIIADAGEKEGSVQAALDLTMLNKYREGLPFLDDLKLL